MAKPLILCYHAVSEDWPAPLAVKPETLREQLGLLLDHGYSPVTVSAAESAPKRQRTLVVTFDDGFRSVAERALPILSDLGVPATVYVATDFPGTGAPLSWPGIDLWLEGAHRKELCPMSWDELRGLAGEGWEIGSHTCSHPRLTCLDDASLERELVDSRDAVAAEVGRCESFAYPYGDVDARVASAVRAVGYRTAVALDPRLWRSLEHLRPRIGVYRSDDRRRFALKTSPMLVRLRSTPAWALVEAARDVRRGPRTSARPAPPTRAPSSS